MICLSIIISNSQRIVIFCLDIVGVGSDRAYPEARLPAQLMLDEGEQELCT